MTNTASLRCMNKADRSSPRQRYDMSSFWSLCNCNNKSCSKPALHSKNEDLSTPHLHCYKCSFRLSTSLYWLQVFLDIVEEVNVLLSSRGEVLSSHVVGRLVMKALLTGMPDIKIGLNDKVEVSTVYRRRSEVLHHGVGSSHKGGMHEIGCCRYMTTLLDHVHAGCEVSSVGQPGPV